MTLTDKNHFPAKYGLYDPQNEKDSCGVGFICNIKGIPSRDIVEEAKEMNIKSIAKKIEYFDSCYRNVEAKISDA